MKVKVQTMSNKNEPGYRRYICKTCDFIFSEELGDPAGGVAPGTHFDDIPDDWVCSLCGDTKDAFILLENSSASNKKLTVTNTDHIIIIGSGYAAWKFVETFRKHSLEAITVITQSNGDYYSRPKISKEIGEQSSNVIINHADKQSIDHNVTLVNNCEAIGIDRNRKNLITDQGIFKYSTLVIASGSSTHHNFNKNLSNLYTIDQLEDYTNFKENLKKSDHIAIIGAGLVGCEVADNLSKNNYNVTIINKHQELIHNLIPPPIAKRLAESFLSSNIKIKNCSEVSTIENTKNNITCNFSDGSFESYDKVVLCIGITSNIDFSKRAGIDTGKHGLIVDEFMRTNDRNIFSLGDCIEINGQTSRFLSSIAKQADVIANEILHNNQEKAYKKNTNTIKIKTSHFPITVHQYTTEKTFDSWKILKSDHSGIKLEIFNNNHVIGIIEGGTII